MSTSTRPRVRRVGSLGAILGVVLTMLFVASPAQAVPAVDLTTSTTTITLGQSVTLSWTANVDTNGLVASGDWSGAKAVPSGSESITPATTGTFTYTLEASGMEGLPSSDTVTVTVVPGPITPNPVTFPDLCTVVIPTTPNVTYFVIDDGDETELTAGTLDGTDYSDPETPVTFVARANQGFTLAPGAIAQWDYTAPESCFDLGPELITTTIDCGTVTFTNTTDGPLDVIYGSFLEDEVDGQFTLAAGASRTVSTPRPEIVFVASPDLDDDESPVQFAFVDVPQDCDDGDESGSGSGSDHPTVAPAAGIAAR